MHLQKSSVKIILSIAHWEWEWESPNLNFNYNSKLRSCELLKIGFTTKCVRERETFYNLFGNTLIYKKINDNNILMIVFLLLFVLFFIIFLYYLITIL